MGNDKGMEENVIDVATIQIAGQEPYKLVLLPGEFLGTWEEATVWAYSIGGELPYRYEQAMLFGYHQDKFRKEWYWSSREHESDPDYVWCQYFGYGYQSNYYRSHKCRARAVRRIPVTSQ